MRFYLGTHQLRHLEIASVPLFVSMRSLHKRKKPLTQQGRLAIDSGGFTELNMYGKWTVSAEAYCERLNRLEDLGLRPDWAAQQDWMVEPFVLKKTGKSIIEHQNRTVLNLIRLRELQPKVHVIPVIQGWSLQDYERCIHFFYKKGVDLSREQVVGVGSVCRRQATTEIHDIMKFVHSCGIAAHGFGVKVQGLKKYANLLTSADSLAWSFGARQRQEHCESCIEAGVTTKNCANCISYALAWRERLVKSDECIQ